MVELVDRGKRREREVGRVQYRVKGVWGEEVDKLRGEKLTVN